jgi:hypothetical protein
MIADEVHGAASKSLLRMFLPPHGVERPTDMLLTGL